MDDDKASRFISSLVKSIQALCNGFVDFSNSIEVVGHIHLNIDRSLKLDYVLTEEVSKSVNEGSTVFASHSYHSHPPSSVSSKSASGSSNHNQKSRRDNEADPLGLSALAREVPNSSKSDFHSGSRVGENSNSSSSVGFSRDSDSESLKPESSRLSIHFDDSSNKRRKMGPLSSQRTHSPAAKRSRVNDFGPNAKTVIKEQGFEVIEIKEEPDEEPNFFDSSGQMAAGQDIQTPDFSNVVMESLDRVTQLEHGGGDAGGDMGSSQPVFPVMFHPSDGSMPSSSAGPMPGPSSDAPSVASTSGVEVGVIYSENETISVQLASEEEAPPQDQVGWREATERELAENEMAGCGKMEQSESLAWKEGREPIESQAGGGRRELMESMAGCGWSRRGRYKNYTESDVMLALRLLVEGHSLRKASLASGVPQSTLTDRMNRLNIKRTRKEKDAYLITQIGDASHLLSPDGNDHAASKRRSPSCRAGSSGADVEAVVGVVVRDMTTSSLEADSVLS